jgi:hypothetical protein
MRCILWQTYSKRTATIPSSAVSQRLHACHEECRCETNSAPSRVSTPQQNSVAAGSPISSPPAYSCCASCGSRSNHTRNLAPWLLVMNGVLQALLVLLASLLLLHHHQQPHTGRPEVCVCGWFQYEKGHRLLPPSYCVGMWLTAAV